MRRHGGRHRSGRSHHSASKSAANQGPPAGNRNGGALNKEPPEEQLSHYTFDEVTREDILSLDIFPQVVSDLIKPGQGVCYLTQIMTIAQNQFRHAKQPLFDTKPVKGYWLGFLTIHFPETKTFTCKNKNKKDCKNICSLAAIHHLRKVNAIDSRLKLNVDSSVTNNFLDNSRGPIPITPLPMAIKQEMMSFTNKFDEYVSNLLDYRVQACKARYESYEATVYEGMHSAILEGLEPDEGIVAPESAQKSDAPTVSSEMGPIDMFTSRPYVSPDPKKRINSFASLQKVFDSRDRLLRSNESFYDSIQAQGRLPIRAHKEEIVSTLNDVRTMVVAGETGSGKSTQVPQFILENLIAKDQSNQFANIAITQPRRISAVSLAERVAYELGERSVGHSVGHNVRFDSKQPDRDLNVMTFFTTGMLLRKLQRNSDLKGVTHLIIDEVHERDCTTDFLLILVKRLLTRRRDLKVILMSASMDAALFARYFDNCPVISVSGRCFPVKESHLDDICREMNVRPPRDEARDRAPKLNLNLLTDLIRLIDETRDTGAILCFMPGWKEMKAMQKELEYCRSRNKLKVMLAHSKLPIHEQRLIFSKVDSRERKVILATNIAETSITINDVRYVIDTGLCNSIDYDPELNMSTFGTRWISRANAKQRAGRAGRTAPGECFKLYSREEQSYFPDYPFPELLRIPLESVIMEAKCHCPEEKAVTFLSQAIQHPSTSAIYNALEELMLLGVLDSGENLTVLGKRISDFSTHPRLSVSLIVASALRCLYPVLNTSAILSSTQEPFLTALTDKSQIRATKERLCNEVVNVDRDPNHFMSDHIAFGNLLAQYDSAAMSKHEHEYFVEECNLNRSAMSNIQECRNLYAKLMVSSKFVSSYEWYSFDSLPNRNMNELDFMIGALVYSFYPKVVRIIRGLVKNGRMYPSKVAPTDVPTNTRVRFASDSIVRHVSLGKQSTSLLRDEANESDEDSDYVSMNEGSEDRRPNFLTYLNSRADQESGQIVIRDGSIVPPMTLLIFGGRDLAIWEPNNPRGTHDPNSNVESEVVNITLDRYNMLTFKLRKDDAYAIQKWRNVWQKYLNWYIHTKNTAVPVDQNDSIIAGTMNDFLQLNKKLYNSLR